MASVSSNVKKFEYLLYARDGYKQNKELQNEYCERMKLAREAYNFTNYDLFEKEIIQLRAECKIFEEILVRAGISLQDQHPLQ
jgi:hypothetical protein